MQLLLEDAGHTVEIVSDGLEALKSLHRATPDLVVTDLMMPGMDGMALVDAIRTDFPYVPVVLVTAFGSEQAAAHALPARPVTSRSGTWRTISSRQWTISWPSPNGRSTTAGSSAA